MSVALYDVSEEAWRVGPMPAHSRTYYPFRRLHRYFVVPLLVFRDYALAARHARQRFAIYVV